MSACGLIVFYLIFSWFWNVWPFNGDSIHAYLQSPNYEVYFHYGDSKEEYLGRVKNLDACAGKAYLWAREKNIVDSSKWKYKCKSQLGG